MQGDSLWKANRSCAESGMVTKSTPANKSACDCTIANPSHDERSPHSTHSRCGDALPAQDRLASARRGSVNRTPCESNVFDDRRTDAIKSGGREPAVVSKNASATASDLRGVVTFATAQSAPAPRGAYAPRSWCRANVCRRKKRFLRCANAHSQERQGSARRGCE
jgi:hypothetical protein